jgi:hypothetical protein
MKGRLFIWSATLGLLGGCQTMTGISHTYPGSWPELPRTTSSECPDISGKYVENGICNYPLHCNSLSLAERFSSTKTINAVPETTVTIKQPSAEQIELSFSTSTGIFTNSLSSKFGEFVCESGAIWIKQGESFKAEGVGVASRKYTMGFMKSSDGSLVGQHRNSGWGLVMWVIPVGGAQILWYKWDSSK